MSDELDAEQRSGFSELKSLIESPPRPVGLEWTRQVCILTRRLVHSFVIAPVDREKMGEARELINTAIGYINSIAGPSPEIQERSANITRRRDTLDQLLGEKAIVPLAF